MMTTEEAFEIVLELAKQNMIDEHETDNTLVAERGRQQDAINVVTDFATAHIWE